MFKSMNRKEVDITFKYRDVVCFQKSANFRFFCISLILLVEPPYFQGRLIMG